MLWQHVLLPLFSLLPRLPSPFLCETCGQFLERIEKVSGCRLAFANSERLVSVNGRHKEAQSVALGTKTLLRHCQRMPPVSFSSCPSRVSSAVMVKVKKKFSRVANPSPELGIRFNP
jgi:hypothetical protein